MIKLTVKKVEVARKSNFGFADFEAKYGLDADETKRQIRLTYSNKSKAEEIIREIAKNSRKQARKGNNTVKEMIVKDLSGKTVEDVTLKTTVADEHAQLLRSLRVRENELSTAVKEYETTYYAKRSEHNATVEQIGESMKKLEQLYQQLETALGETEKLKARETSLVEELKLAQSKMDDTRTQLDEVRRQIEEEKRLVIYVYEDGSIEYSRSDIPNRNKDRWLAILSVLVLNEACRELKQFELHSLATVLATIEQVHAEQYELVADNNQFMVAFDAVRDSIPAAA